MGGGGGGVNVDHSLSPPSHFMLATGLYITCRLCGLAMITVHLNYSNGNWTFWSFFPRRADELDAVNTSNE